MTPTTPFAALLERLRRGDAAAAEELVRRYAPFIRRTLRYRLRRNQLQSLADSGDICQSVLASFFVRVAAGEYELDDATHLEKLLVGMVSKKLAALTRREYADRRDRGRTQSLAAAGDLVDPRAREPSRLVSAQELFEEVLRRLDQEERHLFERRRSGETWEAIAADSQVSPMVLRKRLSRALRRVAVDLGLEDADE